MAKGKYHDWMTEEGLIKLEGWAKDGLTDEQIAKNIGINVATIYEWKNKYPKIAESLRKGKEVIDREVENALLKRALGYEFEETTLERTWNEASECWDLVPTKIVTKKQAPDTTAQIFWLKNRKPKDWRDKHDVEHSGGVVNKNIDISGMSDEEIQKELKKYE